MRGVVQHTECSLPSNNLLLVEQAPTLQHCCWHGGIGTVALAQQSSDIKAETYCSDFQSHEEEMVTGVSTWHQTRSSKYTWLAIWQIKHTTASKMATGVQHCRVTC